VYLGETQAIYVTHGTEYRYLVEADVGIWVEAGVADRLGMGATWNEILAGDNIWSIDSVQPDGSRKFIEPSTGTKFKEELLTTQTVRVLACVDDQGNVVTTNVQTCESLGYTPPTGSCWASVT
jgi:hypothetical protein